MQILQILIAATVLTTSTNAIALWGPFDNDNDRYDNRWNKTTGTITAGTIVGVIMLLAI